MFYRILVAIVILQRYLFLLLCALDLLTSYISVLKNLQQNI